MYVAGIDHMFLFTWNVRENIEAFKLGVKHLAMRAKESSCVAAFQEAPPEASRYVTECGENRLETISGGRDGQDGLVLVRDNRVSTFQKPLPINTVLLHL